MLTTESRYSGGRLDGVSRKAKQISGKGHLKQREAWVQIGTKSRLSLEWSFQESRSGVVGSWLRVQNEIEWGKSKGIPEITRKPPRNCTQGLPDICPIPVDISLSYFTTLRTLFYSWIAFEICEFILPNLLGKELKKKKKNNLWMKIKCHRPERELTSPREPKKKLPFLRQVV